MAHYDVILDYGVQGGATPNPDPVLVEKGDTIAFQLGSAPQASAKVSITIKEPCCFSKAEYTQGDPPIEVRADLSGLVAYDCFLIVNGEKQNRAPTGGGIKPAKGGAAA
jgi:hypothetical protein